MKENRTKLDYATYIRDCDEFPRDGAYYFVMWSLPLFERRIKPHERSRDQYTGLMILVMLIELCYFIMTLRLVLDPDPMKSPDATRVELASVFFIGILFLCIGSVTGLKNLKSSKLIRYTTMNCPRITANGLAKSHVYLFGLVCMALVALAPFFGLMIMLMGYSAKFMLVLLISSFLSVILIHKSESQCWSYIEANLELDKSQS